MLKHSWGTKIGQGCCFTVQTQNSASCGFFPKTNNVPPKISQFVFIGLSFCNYDVYDDEKFLKSKHQGHYSP